MYVLQCPGGYPVPAKAGKFEVTGFCITVNDTAADSEFALVDDPNINPDHKTGKLLGSLDSVKTVLVDVKGLASIDTILNYEFAEPVKTRHGLSIYGNNWVAGSVCVYVR